MMRTDGEDQGRTGIWRNLWRMREGYTGRSASVQSVSVSESEWTRRERLFALDATVYARQLSLAGLFARSGEARGSY